MTEYWMRNRTDRLPNVNILGNAFLQDDRNNKVGVILEDADIPAGAIKGIIIRPDERTIYCTGERNGNRAWIFLPPGAYDKIGTIYVSIRVENNDEKSTLGCFQGDVYRSTTSTII